MMFEHIKMGQCGLDFKMHLASACIENGLREGMTWKQPNQLLGDLFPFS